MVVKRSKPIPLPSAKIGGGGGGGGAINYKAKRNHIMFYKPGSTELKWVGMVGWGREERVLRDSMTQ